MPWWRPAAARLWRAAAVLLLLLAGPSSAASSSYAATCTVRIAPLVGGTENELDMSITCTSASLFQPKFFVSSLILDNVPAITYTGCSLAVEASETPNSQTPALHYNGTASDGSSSPSSPLLLDSSRWEGLSLEPDAQLLLVSGGAAVTLRNATFSGNSYLSAHSWLVRATGGSSLAVEGSRFLATTGSGGVLVQVEASDLTLDSCVFDDSAEGLRGVLFLQSGPNVLVVTNSTFSNLKGGALAVRAVEFNTAGVPPGNRPPVVLRSSSFSDSASGGDWGGAVAVRGHALLVYGCTFERNSAVPEVGGAMAVHESAGVVIRETRFDNNTSGGDNGHGGAVVVWASEADPAAYNLSRLDAAAAAKWELADDSVLLVKNCSFSGNEGNIGGGLAATIMTGTVKVAGTSFTNNMAGAGDGGGLYVWSSSPNTFPGIVLDVSDCTFEGNTASNGGGVCVDECTGGVKVTTTVFTNNFAQSGLGGGLYVEDIAEAGGPMVLMDVSDCTFYANSAQRGGGLGVAGGAGGVQIQKCNFTENSATVGSGGGARLQDIDSSTEATVLADNTFSGNSADEQGGGVVIYNVTVPLLSISSSVFTNNMAFIGGGGPSLPTFKKPRPLVQHLHWSSAASCLRAQEP